MTDLAQLLRAKPDRDLDPYNVALMGDVGAVEPRLVVPCPGTARRRRSKLLTVLVLLAWLAWEAAGVARAYAIGVPVLQAMWSFDAGAAAVRS